MMTYESHLQGTVYILLVLTEVGRILRRMALVDSFLVDTDVRPNIYYLVVEPKCYYRDNTILRHT